MTELLEPRFLAALERLQLGTRRRLTGRFGGEHRSLRHGTSLDFADYREYRPGDDFRRIDYPLYARTDQLFIRLFEAEDDVAVRLVVDRSASMRFHGKLPTAVRLAAVLGFVALVRRDVVTLSVFPDGGAPRRYTGRHATGALFTDLGALDPAGRAEIGAEAAAVVAAAATRGLTVIVSDLLGPGWETAIDRLPGRGDSVVVLHVLAPEELRPSVVGDLELEDAETGEQLSVSLSPAAANRFAASAEAWLERVAGRCRRRGIAYSRISTTDDLEDVVLRGWRDEGVLR